jgi:hypothetical protein
MRQHYQQMRRSRRWVFLTVAITILLAGGGFAYVLKVQGLGPASEIAQLLALILAAISVLQALPSAKKPSPPKLDEVLGTLLAAVRREWWAEIDHRGLNDPVPLVVRWQPTRQNVLMDQPRNISRGALLRFRGRTDQVPALAEEFKKLEPNRRRLVIVSKPGMGKTTLAVLLLNALATPKDADPVPVFFSLSDWNLENESLFDWLTRRIRESYPAVRVTALSVTAVEELVRTSKIVPILDGLDELPQELRPRAIAALNANPENPLVLTCRTRQYKEAVTSPGGRVIRSAVAIEADDLTPGDKAEYLRRCLKSHASLDEWDDILSWVSDGSSNNPLAKALGTPLRLWLLRRIYIDDSNLSPRQLSSFGSADEINEHFLDELIPEVMRASNERLHSRRKTKRRDRAKRGQYEARHSWKPEDAQHWLSYLASYLGQLPRQKPDSPSRNFEWWQLRDRVSLRGIGMVVGAVAGAIFGLALGPVAVPICAFIGAILFRQGRKAVPSPRYANLRLQDRGSELRGNLLSSFRYTATAGLVAILLFWPFIGIKRAWMVGLTFAVAGGIAYTLSDSIATPTNTDDRPSTPQSTLRSDRLMTGVHILAVGISVTLTLWVAFGLWSALAIGLAFALVGGLGSSLKIPFTRIRIPFGFTARGTAWANFIPTRIIFAHRRQFPLRLMSFLDDCYRLQLLKQEGARYQFRHYELQERLTAIYPPSRQ